VKKVELIQNMEVWQAQLVSLFSYAGNCCCCAK